VVLRVDRCIYCFYWKPVETFNKEHVVQQAFGTFGTETPVLSCVCTHCNKTMGDEVDRKIARDSIEALDRVWSGLKKASDYKTEGKRSTLRIELGLPGQLRGAPGYHMPDPDGGPELVATPLPRVGFTNSADSPPVEWFSLDELPTPDQLEERGYKRGPSLRIVCSGVPVSEVQDMLEAAGYKRGNAEQLMDPPNGRIRGEIVATIGDPEFRAVSKIAFNYLAFVGGADFVRLPQFHAIRRFARYGEKLPWQSVRPGPNPWLFERAGTSEPLVGHYVIVRSSEGVIDANVCLFTRVCYAIRLAADPFPMAVTVNAGHLFDLKGRAAVELNVEGMPLMGVDPP
jgi:hypothetical protein